MSRIVQFANECRECPHRAYESGGEYICTRMQGANHVPRFGPIPGWCPLPTSLTEKLQQRCSDWGAYWRASDAHGVVLTQEQALELLREALGVEVELKDAPGAQEDAHPSTGGMPREQVR